MTVLYNDAVHSIYPVGLNVVSEDTSFVAGDSPKVLDVNDALKKNGNRGYIICDGSGSILVKYSHADTNYLTEFTLKSGETFDFTGCEVDTLRIAHSGTDSAYRVHLW